jgi:hypothetical protein
VSAEKLQGEGTSQSRNTIDKYETASPDNGQHNNKRGVVLHGVEAGQREKLEPGLESTLTMVGPADGQG